MVLSVLPCPFQMTKNSKSIIIGLIHDYTTLFWINLKLYYNMCNVYMLTSACEVGSSKRLLESRTKPRLVGRYLNIITEALTIV